MPTSDLYPLYTRLSMADSSPETESENISVTLLLSTLNESSSTRRRSLTVTSDEVMGRSARVTSRDLPLAKRPR